MTRSEEKRAKIVAQQAEREAAAREAGLLPPLTFGRSKSAGKAPRKKWGLPGRPASPKKDDAG